MLGRSRNYFTKRFSKAIDKKRIWWYNIRVNEMWAQNTAFNKVAILSYEHSTFSSVGRATDS